MSAFKSTFRVCTFNAGAGLSDYRRLIAYLNDETLSAGKFGKLPDLPQQKQAQMAKAYGNALKETANHLVGKQGEQPKARVYLLQEVGSIKRPIVERLRENDFAIIYAPDSKKNQQGVAQPDTAIALDKSRFSKIENHSFSMVVDQENKIKKDVAIATAIDAITKQRVVFASIHAPGCDLTKSFVDPTDAARGDFYCQQVAKYINALGQNAIKIIGGDINVNPEKYQERFDIFHGFEVMRTHRATNVNPLNEHDRARELDYFFFSANGNHNQKAEVISRDDVFGPLSGENHCSDHFPVVMDVTLTSVGSPQKAEKKSGSTSHHKKSSSSKSSKPSKTKYKPVKQKESFSAWFWRTLKSCFCFCFPQIRTRRA